MIRARLLLRPAASRVCDASRPRASPLVRPSVPGTSSPRASASGLRAQCPGLVYNNPMSTGLDPAQLTPAASLNRVRFVEVPGLALPPDMLGRTAYELLSARALDDLSRQDANMGAVARRFGERLG